MKLIEDKPCKSSIKMVEACCAVCGGLVAPPMLCKNELTDRILEFEFGLFCEGCGLEFTSDKDFIITSFDAPLSYMTRVYKVVDEELKEALAACVDAKEESC